MSIGAFLGSAFYLKTRVNGRENSCEQDETALSRHDIGCPQPYHSKKEKVPLREQGALRSNV
jgi:hypothetical protein